MRKNRETRIGKPNKRRSRKTYRKTEERGSSQPTTKEMMVAMSIVMRLPRVELPIVTVCGHLPILSEVLE